LGYYRETRGNDHPVALALEYYWDLVENFAKERPKRDEATQALQQLAAKVETLAEQQSAVIDKSGSAWVGKKKGSPAQQRAIVDEQQMTRSMNLACAAPVLVGALVVGFLLSPTVDGPLNRRLLEPRGEALASKS